MSLDKEFLEKILGQPISTFALSAGANLGDNVAGSLKRVKVTTVSGQTLNLVYKGITDDPQGKDFAERFGIFRTETTMYETVASRIEALYKTRGIKSAKFPIPKFYSGSFDGVHDYLLLEDVRPDGYVMPDKFKGLNLSEVTLILKEMARFHASTHFWIKFEGEKIFDESEALSAMRNPPGFKEDDFNKMTTTIIFTNEVKNSVKILKAKGHTDLAQKLQAVLDIAPDVVYKLFRKNMDLTDTSTFPVIIHGDLWLNNIMIKYDKTGNAIDLRFLDFQQSRRGNIFEELEYFFLCSTTPAFRKEHLPQVLNVYYEAFVSTLEELRCPIPIGFTRGSLINTFYEGLLPAYIFMSFAIPLQLAEPLDMEAVMGAVDPPKGPPPTMEESMIKNFEMRSNLLFGQMMESPKAIDRLVDITREMAEMKIL